MKNFFLSAAFLTLISCGSTNNDNQICECLDNPEPSNQAYCDSVLTDWKTAFAEADEEKKKELHLQINQCEAAKAELDEK